ncbi:acyltransferase family protein [soil metagenome]
MTGASGARLGYVPAIDGLRAVAVLSVLLFHLRGSWLPGGFVGVDIFFVISGFVVTGSLAGKRFEGLGALLVYFYARRIVRIVPALLVMLLVTILFYDLFVPDAWLSQSIRSVGKAAFFGISNVELGSATDTYFSPTAEFDPFTHTWSLGVEEQFYLIFPFLLFWFQRGEGVDRRMAMVGAVAILSLASLIACAVLTRDRPLLAFYSIASRFWELGVGMLLSLTLPWWRDRLSGASAAAANALAVTSGAAVLAAFAMPQGGWFPFPAALLPVLGSAGLIASVCGRQGRLQRALGSPPAVGIGRMSYSLYLWHWPVFVLFRWTVGLDGWVEALAAVAIAGGLGFASYRLIEMPTRGSARIAGLPRARVVIGGLVLINLAAFAGITLFRMKPELQLGRTAQHAIWYPGSDLVDASELARCGAATEDDAVANGVMRRWTPVDCTARGRVFVIGDSHSLAYYPDYIRLAGDAGLMVEAWSAPGCTFLPLYLPMSRLPRCDRRFYDIAMARTLAEARPGDVLFLPSLRLPRTVDQWAPVTPAQHAEASGTPELRRIATAEAATILAPFARAGVRIVFEGPKPVLPSPMFRCADWFNAHNPICSGGLAVRRADIEPLRRTVLAQMRAIVARLPGAGIWDPFDILCPGDPCRGFDGALPLFVDGDHLSGHGNVKLYPSLKAYLTRGALTAAPAVAR